MKPWVNIPFLLQPERIYFLEMALIALSEWDVKTMKILIFMDKEDERIQLYLKSINPNVEIIQVNVDEKPIYMPWEHKKYLPEFLASDYTHFIYSDADLMINPIVFTYWNETRQLFKENGFERFIPGTFRIERNLGIDYASDWTHRTNLDELEIIKIAGLPFVIPFEPFQGISIMDKELAEEHLNSPYVRKDVEVRDKFQKFGIVETCISAYIFHNVPEGFWHRVLIPLTNFHHCWIYHLPSNYALNPDSEHGKIMASEILYKLKERID